MNLFDIFITNISWGSGSKSRPVLVIQINNRTISVFSITSQYENKSEAVQSLYFKINDCLQAGLDRQSYIDTGTLLELPFSVFNKKLPIGKLTAEDMQRFLDFLSS